MLQQGKGGVTKTSSSQSGVSIAVVEADVETSVVVVVETRCGDADFVGEVLEGDVVLEEVVGLEGGDEAVVVVGVVDKKVAVDDTLQVG